MMFPLTGVTRLAQFSISAERAFHYILGVILSATAILLASLSGQHESLYLILCAPLRFTFYPKNTIHRFDKYYETLPKAQWT